MNNKHSKIAPIINIILICLINYICFSSEVNSLPVTIISSILLTIMFLSVKTKMSYIYLAGGIISSALVLFSKTTVTDYDYTLNSLIRIFDLYLPSYVLHYCLRNKSLKLGKTLYFTAGAHVLITCFSLAKMKFFDKTDIVNEVNVFYDEFFSIYRTVMLSTSTEMININEINEMFLILKEITIMLIPAFLIIICMVLAYIQIVIARGMSKIYLKDEHSEIEYFYQISVGRLLSTFTIILLLFSFISNSNYISSAIYNFSVIAGFIYFINGMSVAYFYLIKKTKKVFASVLLLILLMIVSVIASAIFPFMNMFTILFIIGLMDSSANFRKLKKVGE